MILTGPFLAATRHVEPFQPFRSQRLRVDERLARSWAVSIVRWNLFLYPVKKYRADQS